MAIVGKQPQKVLANDRVIGLLLGALAAFLLRDVAVGAASLLSQLESLVLGGIVGAVVGQFRRVWMLVVLDGLFLFLYVAVATTPVTDIVAEHWIRSDTSQFASYDAVIVTSGGVLSDGTLNTTSTSRLLSGMEMLRQRRGARLVTTRDGGEAGVAFGDSDRAQLVRLAGAEAGWTRLGPARSTREEALLAAAALLPTSRHIVVVTSPMHTRRACAAFRRVGFSVTCLAARQRDHALPPRSAGDRLSAFRQLVYEAAALVEYRFRGWL